MNKKFQFNLTKIKGVTVIFMISPVMTILVFRYVLILRLGAEGPQQGPKGSQQGLKGPSPQQEL